jgi:hypothetical protein
MSMGHYESERLSNALEQAEQTASKSEIIDVDTVLKIARQEIHFPELKAVWQDTQEAVNVSDLLWSHRQWDMHWYRLHSKDAITVCKDFARFKLRAI